MRYLTKEEVLLLHRRAIECAGGSKGIRSLEALEAAIAQPQMSFGGEDLYPTPAEKAAALGFSLILNHPFIDGNKRVGVLAMDALLVANGVNEQERVILSVAAGEMEREAFVEWLRGHIRPRER
jgi:death on curing protein